MAPQLEEEEDGDAAAGDVGDADGRKGEPPSAPPPPPLEAATPTVVETNQVNEGSLRGVKEEEKEDASASEMMAAQEPTDEVAKESEQDEGEEERQPHQDDDEEAPPRQAHHHEEVDPKQGTAHDDEPGVPTTHDQREGEDDGGGAADEETDAALSAATIVEPIVSSPEMVALLQALALRDAEAISAAAEAARGAGVPAGAVDDLTRDILSSLHREAEARRAAEAHLAQAADAALVPDLTRALASAVEAGVAAHVIFAATAALRELEAAEARRDAAEEALRGAMMGEDATMLPDAIASAEAAGVDEVLIAAGRAVWNRREREAEARRAAESALCASLHELRCARRRRRWRRSRRT